MLKEIQKMKRFENKEVATKDVTEDVFDTPGQEKPVDIQEEDPGQDPKKRKPKPFKRRRMQMRS